MTDNQLEKKTNGRGKRLLLLGGSQWKDAIKLFADEYGVTLLATGNDQNAGIFEIADEQYNVNSTDADAMKKLIHDAKVDGVYMGGSETVINSACKYLNEMGLPCYCTHEQWELFQNKHNFKQLLKKHSLPVCPEYIVDPQNIGNSIHTSEFPVIVKPADGCGSSGFSVCHTADELEAAYKHAAENSPTGTVICEKFVKNQGVVIIYTFSNGKVIFSGVEDKYPVRYEKQGSYVAGLFVFESNYADELRSKYEANLTKLFNAVGLKEGTLWIEVFHDGDNWYFNEAGFRYGGSISVYPVDYVHNINQVYADIHYALTGDSQVEGFRSLIPDSYARGKKYGIYAVHAEAGILDSYVGKEELEGHKNVIKIFLTKPEKYKIESTGSFSQVVALIHFLFSSEAELKEMIDDIHSTFRVNDESGNNLIKRMLDLNKICILI
jgi:formate-dependent phosphoribosylglycinamide formyltransferase (GAR transformylase)